LERKEEKWDVFHDDDILFAVDIIEIVQSVVAARERDQNEKKKAVIDSGGLETSIHPDLTQTG
jgi:hypothetical protein